MIDFLKKTFHIPKFAPGGIIEKHTFPMEFDPPEFVVNEKSLHEMIEDILFYEERKTQMILKKPLLDDLKGIKELLVSQGDLFLASVLNRAIVCVEDQPIIDAVEVVRCKDCRWWQIRSCNANGIKYDCRKTHGLIDAKADSFCSYGERKSNG